MPYGVVLFNDVIRHAGKGKKRTATDGWASIDGGPARGIVSANELESNVKWLTNFEFTDFILNGLANNPNLYYSGFLRTEFKMLADEIGASSEQMSARETARSMSLLFGRIMLLAEHSLGANFNAPSPTTKGLADFLAARIVNKNQIPDDVNQAMKAAHQTWIPIQMKYPDGWKRIMLRRPRYRHATEVLGTPVPSENRWVYIHGARLPESREDRISWCIGNDLPVLANVIVKARRNDFMDIISYNSGARHERSWVCQPELLMLSQFCDVEVVGAFVCEAGFEAQPELKIFPDLGDFSEASISLGVLAENLWVSMASPRVHGSSKKFFPPRAVWYRAMDRLAMFMKAVALERNGFKVYGYGAGAVCAYYPPGATNDLIDFCTESDLDLPMSMFTELKTEVRLNEDE